MIPRVSIPWGLLTDQSSNFMSVLIQEVGRLLQISKLRTSPYHAVCNGLCEKFNGVLVKMLKHMQDLNQIHGMSISATSYLHTERYQMKVPIFRRFS